MSIHIVIGEIYMNKINGYTQEQVRELVEYVKKQKQSGCTLTKIFEEYAKNTGRAKGSVRNYYYSLLRLKEDSRVKHILSGTNLKASKVVKFDEEETREILRWVLTQKSKGMSVRKAVFNLAKGDSKLMLRYQNKYRNMLYKHPETLDFIKHEYGILDSHKLEKSKIQESINNLYDRLAYGLKEENKRLMAVINKLTAENNLLRLQIKNSY